MHCELRVIAKKHTDILVYFDITQLGGCKSYLSYMHDIKTKTNKWFGSIFRDTAVTHLMIVKFTVRRGVRTVHNFIRLCGRTSFPIYGFRIDKDTNIYALAYTCIDVSNKHSFVSIFNFECCIMSALIFKHATSETCILLLACTLQDKRFICVYFFFFAITLAYQHNE